MGTLLVVVDHPFVDDLADLGEAAKQMRIEHLVAEGAVEALDVGVLGGLSWLDVVEAHMMGFAPGDELGGDELDRSVRSCCRKGA